MRIYSSIIYIKNLTTKNRYNSFSSEYELLKLTGIILLVAHFCACGFYYVGGMGFYEKTWI